MAAQKPDFELLVARCLKNDGDAQHLLYRLFAPRMLGVCERYTGSDAEAEDVLQDAFVRVFAKLKDFRNDGALEGWVYRIVVTTALSHYKREKAHRQLHVIDEMDVEIADSEATAIEQMSAEEVFELMKKLPDGCRVVLNLFAVEGYSHAEISKLLGIQESTSKSQVCRARKLLVRMFEKQEQIQSNGRIC